MRTQIEGVTMNLTPNKKLNFDYGPGDMQAVYNRGPWKNWKEGIAWLEKKGEADNELTPGETIALVEDLRSVAQAKEPFTDDPVKAYRMAHKHRAQNNKKYAQEHQQVLEMAKRAGR